ncbi:MAG: metallophosphoesterase, partial [Kiritimatiellae bacterium]|nr:metallophosphoesterase [Kiritimatiellia bacterium]
MNKGILSRRSFVACAGAFGGVHALAAPIGHLRAAKPNLRVGILSDVHVRTDGTTGRIVDYSDDRTFVHALEWFRDMGVDAVAIAGDITDYGKLSEMKVVADDWFRVFPDDRAPDGHKVERLFVMGNHDWDYFPSDAAGNLRRYGSAASSDIPKNLICGAPEENWQRFWHEPLSRVFMKNVKGYTFFGAHWMGNKGAGRYAPVKPFIESHRHE